VGKLRLPALPLRRRGHAAGALRLRIQGSSALLLRKHHQGCGEGRPGACRRTLSHTGSTSSGMVRLRGRNELGGRWPWTHAPRERRRYRPASGGLRLGGPWNPALASVNADRSRGARIWRRPPLEDAQLTNRALPSMRKAPWRKAAWVLRRAKIKRAFRFRGARSRPWMRRSLWSTPPAKASTARARDRQHLILDGAKMRGRAAWASPCGRRVVGEGGGAVGQDQDWALAAAGLFVDQGVSISAARIKGGVTSQVHASARACMRAMSRSMARPRDRAEVMHVGGNWDHAGATINGSIPLAGARIDGPARLHRIENRRLG